MKKDILYVIETDEQIVTTHVAGDGQEINRSVLKTPLGPLTEADARGVKRSIAEKYVQEKVLVVNK